MIGKTISHYRITEELGRGGMGVVYKAEDSKLHRTVALKFLPAELISDPDAKARFIREARAAAALNHPNIATIHEINEADGHTYIAMEYVEGESLRNKMRSGALPVEEALTLVTHVARGLTKAHGKGIVHRDIKPGNILLTADGEAKIVDFGLAKLGTQSRITRTGTTLGTVAYMSPEQVKGEEIDHRSDIWSLSVMLYEMLTGALPFKGDYEPALMYSILNERPEPLTSVRSDVPIAIEDILEKALSKDPTKRYQTMEELLKELETQHDHMTLGIKERQHTVIRKIRRKKRLFAGLAAAIVVIVISVVLFRLLYEPGTGIDSLAVLPFTNLSGDPEQEYFSDGMTESLINELGRIEALNVISRNSVMQFKNAGKSPQEVAQALDVDAVVTASVMRIDDKIKITAQLRRVEPLELLWSDSYNRHGIDVMIVLNEVTKAIASQIRIAVTPEEEERLAQVRTVNKEAHDAYLKGRYYTYEWTEEGMKKGFRCYQEAIESDPTYALPYAGLADYYITSVLFGYMSQRDGMPKARAAAKKALELDTSLGIAHAYLGWIKFDFDWDWYGPDADFRRAVELNPNNPDVHIWYNQYLTYVGRFDEAIAHTKRAIEIDPITYTTAMTLPWAYEYAGRYDEEIEATKAAMELSPSGDPYGPLQLAGGYLGKKMYAEAIALTDSALALLTNPDEEVFLMWAAWGYAAAGSTEKAEEILNTLLELSEREYVQPLHIAMVYGSLGRADEMFEWLEKNYETRAGGMMSLRINFGKYRDDPRYIDLCRRVGIPLD